MERGYVKPADVDGRDDAGNTLAEALLKENRKFSPSKAPRSRPGTSPRSNRGRGGRPEAT